MNIPQIIEKNFSKTLAQPALIFNDKAVTFGECKEIVFKFANGLKDLGIKRQDKVAVYLPNCPEYVYSYLALWSIGATVVPLDFMLTDYELESCISHSEARFLIAKDKEGFSAQQLKQKLPLLKDIIFCEGKKEGFLSFEEILNKGKNIDPKVEVKDSDYAIIFYTSGTTGKPKGVLTSYKQLEAPVKNITYFVKDFSDQEVEVAAVPFSHLGGLVYILNFLFLTSRLVIMDRFLPLDFLKNVERYKATSFFVVPSMFYAFLRLKELENLNLSSLKWIDCFGAPSSPDALRRFHSVCPQAVFYHGWGMTETNAPTTCTPSGSNKLESVGKPAPGYEIKIFDNNDKELPLGQIGEIVVRGWVVTDGYYKDPELTKYVMRSGWFHTEDLGKFDEESFLYIMGRKKEMIKVAGEIVFEPEIEAVLQKHPEVAEAAVIGVPDKLRGEVPRAFVVLKEGSSLDEEKLRYFSREHLAHFKIPHSFIFTNALPKNRAGKIDKVQLKTNIS